MLSVGMKLSCSYNKCFCKSNDPIKFQFTKHIIYYLGNNTDRLKFSNYPTLIPEKMLSNILYDLLFGWCFVYNDTLSINSCVWYINIDNFATKYLTHSVAIMECEQYENSSLSHLMLRLACKRDIIFHSGIHNIKHLIIIFEPLSAITW